MERRKKMLSGVLVGSIIGMGMLVSPAMGEETTAPTVDVTLGLYSKYVWRGYELSKDSLVIQPSVTVGYQGFAFNLWGNLDTDQTTALYTEDGNNWNETDMTLSYDGSYGMLGYTVGYIYYALEGIDDTQEIYGGLSVDVIGTPTLTVYRDVASAPGWYITLEVSRSFDLMDNLALNLGAKLSYLAVDDETTLADPNDPTSSYSDFHDGTLSMSLSYSVTDNLVITPELYYSFALGGDARDVLEAASADGDDAGFFYGGVAAGFSF